MMTMIMMMFLAGIASGQQKPVTGYAPVNGLKMYYEIKGSGEPVVLLHGAFMAITDDWRVWINELAKTRKVIAFLHPYFKDKIGATPVGTFSSALDPAGDKLYITWNVSRGSRAWDCCAMTVIHIPESERRP